MIPNALVDEVKRLLSEGRLSQRKIARRVGVSRGTVNAIARGKRPDYEARAKEDDFLAPAGPLARCSTCGGMVYMPCLACGVRAMKDSRQRPRDVKRSRRPSVFEAGTPPTKQGRALKPDGS
ncbi:MAG: winged helix-turn-helix transcriptional regulator [Planctomycetota bacterium]|jgi:hypothetical protein